MSLSTPGSTYRAGIVASPTPPPFAAPALHFGTAETFQARLNRDEHLLNKNQEIGDRLDQLAQEAEKDAQKAGPFQRAMEYLQHVQASITQHSLSMDAGRAQAFFSRFFGQDEQAWAPEVDKALADAKIPVPQNTGADDRLGLLHSFSAHEIHEQQGYDFGLSLQQEAEAILFPAAASASQPAAAAATTPPATHASVDDANASSTAPPAANAQTHTAKADAAPNTTPAAAPAKTEKPDAPATAEKTTPPANNTDAANNEEEGNFWDNFVVKPLKWVWEMITAPFRWVANLFSGGDDKDNTESANKKEEGGSKPEAAAK
ncbi:MAG: hypothetical protein SFZ03_09240 [Candidatus Melainabacteria bacterium]|nr:hypothetical protein [Candidatus Melainabacteria bacterium]